MIAEPVVVVFELSRPKFPGEQLSRRAGMASAFSQLQCKVVQAGYSSGSKEFVGDHEIPATCGLLLVHGGDDSYLPALRKRIVARHIIYYSGDGGYVDRKKLSVPSAPVIQRPILYARAALTPGEARELLEFSSTDGAILPALLTPDLDDATLIALAILCQGYLAVYAKEASGSIEGLEPAVEPALQRMGWRGTPHASAVQTKLETTEVSLWWNSALGFEERSEDACSTFRNQIDQFESRLKDFWPIAFPAELSKLCAFLRGPETRIDPSTVASCYTTIADRLQGGKI